MAQKLLLKLGRPVCYDRAANARRLGHPRAAFDIAQRALHWPAAPGEDRRTSPEETHAR